MVSRGWSRGQRVAWLLHPAPHQPIRGDAVRPGLPSSLPLARRLVRFPTARCSVFPAGVGRRCLVSFRDTGPTYEPRWRNFRVYAFCWACRTSVPAHRLWRHGRPPLLACGPRRNVAGATIGAGRSGWALSIWSDSLCRGRVPTSSCASFSALPCGYGLRSARLAATPRRRGARCSAAPSTRYSHS